jgi:hypothetical protein
VDRKVRLQLACESVDWVQLAHDTAQCSDFEDMVINLSVHHTVMAL